MAIVLKGMRSKLPFYTKSSTHLENYKAARGGGDKECVRLVVLGARYYLGDGI